MGYASGVCFETEVHMAFRVACVVAGLVVLLGIPTGGAAQDPSPLEGVWVAQESTIGDIDGLVIFYGEHYALMGGAADRPNVLDRTGPEPPSAEELQAAWGPFAAHAGVFELTGGNTMTVRPAVAKNDPGPTSFLELRFALEDDGNTLVLTELRTRTPGDTEMQATVWYRKVR